MAFTKITAAGIGSTETVTLDGLSVINNGSFGGNLTVGGVLTYEDVTNVDSVGLITARNGIVVGSGITLSKDGDIFATGITTVSGNVKVGTGITLSPDGDGFFTGVVTATSYYGDGSNLSNITSTTINNNADNRLITGSGTANTLNGESNFTFDGTRFIIGASGNSWNTITRGDLTHYSGFQFNDSGATRAYLGISGASGHILSSSAQHDAVLRSESNLLFGAGGNSERVRIDSSGRVLIGLTASSTTDSNVHSKLQVVSSAGPNIAFGNNSTDINDDGRLGTINFSSNHGGTYHEVTTIRSAADADHASNSKASRLELYTTSSGNTSGTERVRIDSNGVTMLGTGAITTPKITGPGGLDVSQYALSICMGGSSGSSGQARADATTKEARLVIPHYTNAEEPVTCIYAYSQNDKNVVNIGGGTGLGNNATEIYFNAASDITTTGSQLKWEIRGTGHLIGTTPAVIRSNSSGGSLSIYGGATNHGGKIAMYGGNSDATIRFYSQTGTSSPTERVRIDENELRHGATSILAGSLDDVRIRNSSDYKGLVLRGTGGSGGIANYDEYCFLFNRMGSDGSIITFNAQGSEEGSISVSGSTVSYNGGHLSRWSQLVGISTNVKSDRPTIYQGTVMSNLDEMCEWPGEENQQLNKTKVSDTVGDKDVAGVFWTWDDDDDVYTNDFFVAMTGDMVIRVAASTTVARGDLLESAGDGTAKPQSDDIVRSKTIAKITSTTSTATYDDGSKAYPCVLMGS